MDTASWVKQVEVARTPEDVLRIANAYIDSRSSSELTLLPEQCRLSTMHSIDEIADCAYRLAAYHSHDDHARVIQRLAHFFSRASVRLAELGHRAHATDR